MTLRGARLKLIAEMTGLPMALQQVKPGAARLAIRNNKLPEDLIHQYLPRTTWSQKVWLQAVNHATRFGPDFTEWTAKNALNLGRKSIEVSSQLSDISGWIRASVLKNIPDYMVTLITGDRILLNDDMRSGCNFITRPFSKEMSLHTVSQLSQEWHEAVASKMSNGKLQVFPPPWFDGGDVNGYTIVPIQDSAELYRESKIMHNCAATYSDRVLAGQAYIYSVRSQDERVANFELRVGDGIQLGQLRGPCNTTVSRDITKVVMRWLFLNKRKHGIGRYHAIQRDERSSEPLDELPF